MLRVILFSFVLVYASFAFGVSDQNDNGIYDNFDTVIDKLPTATMRIAARQVAFNLQAQIETDVSKTSKEELQILMLNQLISHECFEEARINSGSTINNNYMFIALAQLATNDAQRASLKTTQNALSTELFQGSAQSFNELYERLSPFFGDISACDHLN